ncbi:type I restriction enzyme M protein [Capnocytophaga leadbetteri]|uniref:Type I restriction enzyme M protein n=1 Tax=Capnocytophaga leadbetteri TaxID=327575 RepID=A0A2T5XU46_9FLAO|nr:N-6 DNA methylase [Capnocytophaga leadbetteri]PTX06446.1 type I restriction enzyme M protein [Capnocytophaga leadbetteri]
MNTFLEGIKRGLISISEDEKTIKYIHQNKSRNFTNPEEKVQAEAFVLLVTQYNYKPERIKMFVPVKMGVETKEADIVVYNDDECTEPHILVECKKADITDPAFNEAVNQAYSYAYAMPNNVKYVWVTSSDNNKYFEVDKNKNVKKTLPDIPQFGVKKLANYKFVYGAKSIKQSEEMQSFFDLQVIEQAALTNRFKRAHDALWGGGHLNPSEAFDELDKLIFCKIWDEKKDRKEGDPYDFQIITVDASEIKNFEKLGEDELIKSIQEEENKRLFNRVKELYEEGRKKDPEVFRDNIRLTSEKIRTVVEYLQDINIGETDLDAKGRAFETFMNSFFRGNFGQFFTPREIVKFIVDVLPITNESLVLDTSCGSGGFLLYALNKVRQQADEWYPNYKTNIKQYPKHFSHWHDFAEKNLYGIEINEQISRAAKMNMIIHDDGHTNVITSDGLLPPEEIEKKTENRGFKYNHFDFIITNPPFGSIVRQTEKAYLKEYKLGKKEEDWLAVKSAPETVRENQSTEVLFIEQCYNFLKAGGYLAIVIPDGILTNSSLQYVRDHIEETFRIVAVVSLPQTAFAANGAGVKSSVLFLKKYTKDETQQIRDLKQNSKHSLLSSYQYKEKVKQLESEKKQAISALEKQYKEKHPSLDKKGLAPLMAEEKKEIQEEFSEKVNNLKEELQDAFLTEKQKKLKDYPIFMAIAEEIGYDATGKKIAVNELDVIGEELERFINAINNEEI